MNDYIILLRGINVGGKNKVSMRELKDYLEELECTDVLTYINSGNVFARSTNEPEVLRVKIEDMLPRKFKLDSPEVKVLVLTSVGLKAVVDNKPEGFGDSPEKYHSDVIFLMGIDEAEAMSVFNPREGVYKVWQGKGVIYSQRLSAFRTKSRLSQAISTPAYKSMTIRSWSTTIKLLQLSQARGE